MATLYGDKTGKVLNTDPPERINPTHFGSSIRSLVDRIELDGASIDDVVILGYLPKTAVLTENSVLHFDALGASTTMDLGFPDQDDDALIAAHDTTSAGSVDIYGSDGELTHDDLGKQLWELAGYSSIDDAPQQMKVGVTLEGGAGTGTVTLALEYAQDA